MLRYVLLLLAVAAVVYLTVRLAERHRRDDPGRGALRRPVGPDDDPEFLRHLERKRRRERGKGAGETPPDDV